MLTVILVSVIILPKTVGVRNNLKIYPTEAKIDLNVINESFKHFLPWVESAFFIEFLYITQDKKAPKLLKMEVSECLQLLKLKNNM